MTGRRREKEVKTTDEREVRKKIPNPAIQAFAIPFKSWQHQPAFYQSEREE